MSARRFAMWVVAGIALIQAAWILVVPPFGGIDEFDHAYRASAVAHGQWMPGPYADAGRGRLVRVPESLVTAAGPQCRSLLYTGRDNCSPVGESHDGMVAIASAAASYNPVFYWVIGTIARPFEGAAALYAMRIATAVGCLLLIGAGAWALTVRRAGTWRATGVLLALSPVAIYSTAVAAPNGPEIAAGFALWCALLGLAASVPRRTEAGLITVAGVAAAALGNLRELGPGFLVVTLVLCVAMAPRRTREVVSRHRVLVGLGVALAVLAVAQQAWWVHAVGQTGGVQTVHDRHTAWNWVMPIGWQLGAIAAFPFRNQPAPPVVYAIFGLALISLWIAAVRRARGRLRAGLLVLTVGVLCMPLVLTALSYARVGVIWQGRYGLPLAVGVPLLAGVVLSDWRPRALPGLAAIFVVGLAVIEAASLVHVRSLETADKALRAHPEWHPPPVLLLAVLAVLAAATHLRAMTGGGALAGSAESVSEQAASGPPLARAQSGGQESGGMES